MKVRGTWRRGRPKRRWLDKVNDMITVRGGSVRPYYRCVHGGVCPRTSTPHIGGNKKKELTRSMRDHSSVT